MPLGQSHNKCAKTGNRGPKDSRLTPGMSYLISVFTIAFLLRPWVSNYTPAFSKTTKTLLRIAVTNTVQSHCPKFTLLGSVKRQSILSIPELIPAHVMSHNTRFWVLGQPHQIWCKSDRIKCFMSQMESHSLPFWLRKPLNHKASICEPQGHTNRYPRGLTLIANSSNASPATKAQYKAPTTPTTSINAPIALDNRTMGFLGIEPQKTAYYFVTHAARSSHDGKASPATQRCVFARNKLHQIDDSYDKQVIRALSML